MGEQKNGTQPFAALSRGARASPPPSRGDVGSDDVRRRLAPAELRRSERPSPASTPQIRRQKQPQKGGLPPPARFLCTDRKMNFNAVVWEGFWEMKKKKKIPVNF